MMRFVLPFGKLAVFVAPLASLPLLLAAQPPTTPPNGGGNVLDKAMDTLGKATPPATKPAENKRPARKPSPADTIRSEMLLPRGTYYDSKVPDTLDLADRAALIVRGLTRSSYPNARHAPPHEVFYQFNPPHMISARPGEGFTGSANWGKINESLHLARMMSGSREFVDIEEKMFEGMLTLFDFEKCPHVNYIPGVSRGLLALTILYQRNPTPELRAYIEGYVDFLARNAVYSGTTANFWDAAPLDAYGYGYGLQAFMNGTPLRALARWHQASGDAKSKLLAEKLKTFMLDPKYWVPEAGPKSFIGAEHGHFNGHSHCYTAGLLALLQYAQATHDPRLVEFVRGGYHFMRSFGIARIGLFGEMCTTGDMTNLAIKLSDTGAGDYWNDADGYVRNHLTELQITDANKLSAVVDALPKAAAIQDSPVFSYDKVIERTVGAWFSDSTHPTLIPRKSLQWTICCSGNCPPALYAAWEGIVRCDGNAATINLLLNRASPWLDIDSYLPYEGKVVVKNKTARSVHIRIPAWVDRAAVKCAVNGRSTPFQWVGNLVCLHDLQTADHIELTFPMTTTVERYTLTWADEQHWFEGMQSGGGRTVYTLTMKGNTLVDVSPRSKSQGYPLYQRNYERDHTAAPMKGTKRFVSAQTE